MKPARALLPVVAFALSAAHAEVRLSALFCDHKVVQADKGGAGVGMGTGVKVSVFIGGQSQSTVTRADGRWHVNWEPLKSTPPIELTVQGGNRVVVREVLLRDLALRRAP